MPPAPQGRLYNWTCSDVALTAARLLNLSAICSREWHPKPTRTRNPLPFSINPSKRPLARSLPRRCRRALGSVPSRSRALPSRGLLRCGSHCPGCLIALFRQLEEPRRRCGRVGSKSTRSSGSHSLLSGKRPRLPSARVTSSSPARIGVPAANATAAPAAPPARLRALRACSRGRAFSGKVDTGFPSENANNKPRCFPIL